MIQRIKICGITQPAQGRAIAELGATALGFICAPSSPRYVSPPQIAAVVAALPTTPTGQPQCDRVGVFVNPTLATVQDTVAIGQLNSVQLHGSESPEFCVQVRATLPSVELIKAFRIRTPADLERLAPYASVIDTLLLDAYHPTLAGGTGQTLDWRSLQHFAPSQPWLLAGGLTPDNVGAALAVLHPTGIDLSSGVERAPGDKDLALVQRLFAVLASC